MRFKSTADLGSASFRFQADRPHSLACNSPSPPPYRPASAPPLPPSTHFPPRSPPINKKMMKLVKVLGPFLCICFVLFRLTFVLLSRVSFCLTRFAGGGVLKQIAGAYFCLVALYFVQALFFLFRRGRLTPSPPPTRAEPSTRLQSPALECRAHTHSKGGGGEPYLPL